MPRKTPKEYQQLCPFLKCWPSELIYCIRAKLSSGKTFAVVCKIHFSLENFHGASGHGHHVLYTASDSRGNFCDQLKIRKNRESFPTRKFCSIRYSLQLLEIKFINICFSRNSYTKHANLIKV